MTNDLGAGSSSVDGLWGLARRLGGLRWVESQLFAVSGGWVPSTEEPDVRVAWAVQSQHHGWHAEVLRDRLPELRHLDVDTLTAPAAGWDDLMGAVAALTSTPERLSAWFGLVVPALVAEYEQLAEALDEVATPGLRRWLDHVLLDERADLSVGLGLLAAHPGGEAVLATLSAPST
jgi:hypothetical protein